ncbi:triose-phosphate isomerase [Buchnera aphidicola]|uniref:triose-phosphate isomerase n=1 Tax=Buchnera aphidicola TaxID=9 RepID=UPI003463A49F
MKQFLIVANWKLNQKKIIISKFLMQLQAYLSCHIEKNIIVIAPAFVYLDRLCKNIVHKNLFVSAQNIDVNLSGSFTGEVSILMLKDIGVKYVILGHSERRIFHYENNDIIAKKFYLAKSHNLIPILCIGETKEEKKLKKTYEILKNQINCIFNICGKSAFRNTVIAYEPIWAIGTGQSADAEKVQIIHQFIKNYIAEHDSVSIDSLIIQYGGSISSLNAKPFLEQPDISGLLIGNASLEYKEFLKIIKIAHKIY